MIKSTLFYAIIIVFTPFFVKAQAYQELSPMPESVTNNAVCGAKSGGVDYLYSFTGLDSTKIWTGLHLKALRYNTQTNNWENLPSVPDPMGGKIAAGVSTVKNKIYLIGGYHVLQNGGEISSKKVHIFDPESNAWLADGIDIPVAIDDHVQMVWRDSLIFVVTGWSNTTNVPNVQIYNPSSNTWTVGTAVPNTIRYKVFGASGGIVGDTLYYMGGARTGSNFPATNIFRKGAINPDNPSEITWSDNTDAAAIGYRMAAVETNNLVLWMGGSAVTYNYDGIAYNGSGGVSPNLSFRFYDPTTGGITVVENMFPPLMDLRGAAKFKDGRIFLAGGMEANQKVSNKTYVFKPVFLLDTKENGIVDSYSVFPNPFSISLQIDTDKPMEIQVFDENGQFLEKKQVNGRSEQDFSRWPNGRYMLHFYEKGRLLGVEKVVKTGSF